MKPSKEIAAKNEGKTGEKPAPKVSYAFGITTTENGFWGSYKYTIHDGKEIVKTEEVYQPHEERSVMQDSVCMAVENFWPEWK